jgi:hypothetical protein
MIPHPPGSRLDVLEPSFDVSRDDGGGPLPSGAARRARRWRRLWAWSATSAPIALLLVAGMAVGPRGLSLLSATTLALLDPVVPVALAALGVLVGLSASVRRTDTPRTLAIATLAAAVTMLVVSAGFGVIAFTAMPANAAAFWILIVTAGSCAATALTLPSEESLEPQSAATRVIELGVILPIVTGGLVLAWLRTGSPLSAVALVAQASAVTLALAAAAWLLLTRTTSETEERVFAVSALLLVGGAAAAFSLSALAGGLIAGGFWGLAGRHPRETLARDVLFVQHPLLVLVLLVAGAHVELSVPTLALGLGYIALRTAGQLAAGIVVRRVAGMHAPRDLGLHLLSPGVFGVGLALNAVGVVGADASMLLGAVVTGAIGAEIVAVLLAPRSVE